MSDIQSLAATSQAPVSGNGQAVNAESVQIQKQQPAEAQAEQREERAAATEPGVGENVDIQA